MIFKNTGESLCGHKDLNDCSKSCGGFDASQIAEKKQITLQEALDKSGFTQYTNKEVVQSYPPGNATDKPVEFFTLGRYVPEDELEKEYESRGLQPIDPYTLLNIPVHILDEKKYVGTHWKNADGKWCFAAFVRWYVERKVLVSQSDLDWFDGWSFGGVRKIGTQNYESQTSSESLPLALPNELTINGVIYIRK